MLNKCEELRVFDDPYIQNLNPFDEGFRKAIDDRDDYGFLAATSNSTTDTLHTPQIIPDFVARHVKDEKLLRNDESRLPMQDEPENLSTTPDVMTNIPKITISESSIEKLQHHHQPQPILPKPNIIYAAPILTTTATSLHLNHNNHHECNNKSNESVKDKLKSIILNGSTSSSSSSVADSSKRMKIDTDTKLNLPAILIQTVPLIAPANLLINNTSKLKIESDVKPFDNGNSSRRTIKSEAENSTKRKSSTSNNKPDSAALKVERNRAAARRYRNKMKIQGQALRDKYDRSQKEIAQLKKEITDLKKLLLLHKECEVTKNLI